VAVAMRMTEMASTLEAISFVTGALCVWLTVRESLWNFPISLINVATFAFVFFQARLFADAGLQLVYFILTAVGWYCWLWGGERQTRLQITSAPRTEMTIVICAAIVLTAVLWRTLHLIGGSASFFDAFTTSLSLCAQWLLNRKRVDTWMFWITVDVIYVPLYAWKGLYLTAGLCAVFLVMATMGLLAWRAKLKAQRPPIESGELVAEA
jgi:nicotinamide mononucleotide transporter